MKNRHLVVSLALVATATLPGLDARAAGPPPTVPCSDARGCPDLVADPATMSPKVKTKTIKPQDCQVVEGMVQPGTRKLLRFTFTTPNFGVGDLIVGRPEDHPESFEFSDCHGHFHFREYADYRLWTPAQHQQWESLRQASPDATAAEVLAANPGLQPVTGEKRGFCVIDIVQYQTTAPPKFLVCDFQGISVGWADEYNDDLDGQFIDVTGVAPGTYVLEEEVNAERVFEESDYTNNRAFTTVTI